MCHSVAIRYGWTAAILNAAFVIVLMQAGFAEDAKHAAGRQLFEKTWVHDDFIDPVLVGTDISNDPNEVGDGLGPLYNAVSCAQCHENGGASGVEHNVTMITLDPRSRTFNRSFNTGEGRRDLMALFPGVFSTTGRVSLDSVVHNYSSRPGYERIREGLSDHVPNGIPEAWFDVEHRTTTAISNQPVIAGRYETLDFYLSQRNSPPLHGLGLVDAISNETLDRQAKLQRRASRGKITGRRGVGKFGWRAQTTTLASFVRGACTGELGLSQKGVAQPMDPADWSYRNRGVDISESDCVELTNYVKSLGKPIELEPRIPSRVKEGRRQFYRLGCISCHVKDMGPATSVYSDFLLHDMGEKLQAPSPAPLLGGIRKNRFVVKSFAAANSPVFPGASIGGYYGSPLDQYPIPFALKGSSSKPVAEELRLGAPQFPWASVSDKTLSSTDPDVDYWETLMREWRTPPLWGLADSGPYLHDGRAATIDEAIRWHDGEAKEAAEKYGAMAEVNRQKLLMFLETLAAPSSTEHVVLNP